MLNDLVAFETVLAQQCLRPGASGALCWIEFGMLNSVTITAGAWASGALASAVAGILDDVFDGVGTIARLGDSVFAILLPGVSVTDAHDLIETLPGRFAVEIDGGPIDPMWRSFNAGVTEVMPGRGPALLLRRASAAADLAREGRRNRIVIDDAAAVHGHTRTIKAMLGLRDAIAEGRLRLYAQEIVTIAGAGDGQRLYEVTVRMIDDEDGSELPPTAVIPAAERHGLIRSLDLWVIRTVLLDRSRRFAKLPRLSVSLNLSGITLADPGLWSAIEPLVDGSALAPEQIMFEITETAGIQDTEAAVAFCRAARAKGCKVALDDFGSGHSGLNYLRAFPVDCVKIDGSVVLRADDPDAIDRSIIESVITLGRRHGMSVIAEHVDSHALMARLRDMGIRQVQGFLLSRPAPLDEVLSDPAYHGEPQGEELRLHLGKV